MVFVSVAAAASAAAVAAAASGSSSAAAASTTNSASPFKVSFNVHQTHEVRHASGLYNVTSETYYSNPISLKAGHMIFTKPEQTPLTLPSGRIGITSFFGDIVDCACACACHSRFGAPADA